MNSKTVTAFVIILFGSFVSGYFGPWWAPAVFNVITLVLLGLTVKRSILISTIALGLVYLGMSLWLHMQDTAGILEKTGSLLGGLSSTVLILVTTIIGIITGLLSGWLGSEMGKLFRK